MPLYGAVFLPEPGALGFDQHLEGCPGCRAALALWRSVAGLAGLLIAADVAGVDPYVRERFLAVLAAPRQR
ncbi:hypothetical protein [Streptomyces himalayensis]|uniref:Zinc-finger domain-containing protein n=1 Tax=Streptomyces himalayensis subsp. himalayensis TaxID=2756131 RepID=A0A7W0DIM5_9ACTN|nr:hypothetical protein [Streptomyces himalayensis]MBA2945054.1 hypothetical protein [Streptomyces himalayensis subsp. himalayensis]